VTSARRSRRRPGTRPGSASPRGSAREQGGAVGLAEEGLSGTGAGAAVPLPGAGPFDWRVITVGGVVFTVLMALSARYGRDLDELYILDGARHLQASWVDQPVLATLLAWVCLKLLGVSLPGLRVCPALAAWATVVVDGLTARKFGGGRRSQLLAAVGAATMPVLLAHPGGGLPGDREVHRLVQRHLAAQHPGLPQPRRLRKRPARRDQECSPTELSALSVKAGNPTSTSKPRMINDLEENRK